MADLMARSEPLRENADDVALVQQADAKADAPAVAGRGAPRLTARNALALQQQIGNAAVARLAREAAIAHEPAAADVAMKSKVKGVTGGVSGLTLNVTYSVSGVQADTLQCVQAWWGRGSTLGQAVGTPMRLWLQTYEAFIDGGKNSPWVTLSGNPPAHPKKPYYLTAAEHKDQVTWDPKTKSGTIRIYDQPTASAYFDEMNFETAIVAVNHDGKGTDKIVRVFTWGNRDQGKTQMHEKGDEIDKKYSHLESSSTPSLKFMRILNNDYPKYAYSGAWF